MNRHQVLTGAVNPGDSCFAIGYVDGVPFTVILSLFYCQIAVLYLSVCLCDSPH